MCKNCRPRLIVSNAVFRLSVPLPRFRDFRGWADYEVGQDPRLFVGYVSAEQKHLALSVFQIRGAMCTTIRRFSKIATLFLSAR